VVEAMRERGAEPCIIIHMAVGKVVIIFVVVGNSLLLIATGTIRVK
jgi:hypothetical protein